MSYIKKDTCLLQSKKRNFQDIGELITWYKICGNESYKRNKIR